MDKLFIKKNYLSFNTEDGNCERRFQFDNKTDLCDLIFHLFNNSNYYKVFLNKKVEATDNNIYGVEEVNRFYNTSGYDALKIVSYAEYLNLIQSFLYQFGYSKKMDTKKLSLK